MRTKLDLRSTKERRKLRTRSRVKNVADRPRLCVFRSNQYIYGQIVDIETGITVTGISSKMVEKADDDKGKISHSFKAGQLLAEKALEKNISEVAFDRACYKYHGRVKAFADGARKGGLKF